MSGSAYGSKHRREQEQLKVTYGLIDHATRDTVFWLQTDPSAEERVYVLAMQERLADLARIIERRMERRSSPKDGSQWSETAREVLALLEKAREVRGNIVGKGLARLMDHLPQKLLDQSPRPKLPEPIRPVALRYNHRGACPGNGTPGWRVPAFCPKAYADAESSH
jgi:hypothetical protein